MNLPVSNFRGFFEILMPGLFLVLNVILSSIILGSSIAPELIPAIKSSIKYLSNPAIILLLIVIGYLFGVVLRLLKTTNIDTYSKDYISRLKPKKRDSSYLTEDFFYGKWMEEKIRDRLPKEAALFYEKNWGDKDKKNAQANTTFFNFCKTIITKHDPQSGNEIFAAEALSRFVAGSFYALIISFLLMLLNAICVYKLFSLRAGLLPLIIAFGYAYLIHVILAQFRFLRCKEVDTVFNACFANREHFAFLFPCISNSVDTPLSKYDIRKNLIFRAWIEKWKNEKVIQAVDFHKLISLMKSESREYQYLSSIYFAGSYIDHPFFLENSKLSIGIAVLPEDEPKASHPKKHPHQTEIIVVMQGSLCLYYEHNSKIIEKILYDYDHFVIDKGICHWISSYNDNDAVYLFIKTNPSQEPRGENCMSAGYRQ